MKPFTVTDHQKRFFHTFGYLHFPALFQGEIDRITEEFERVFERHGTVHDGKKRSSIAPFGQDQVYLASLPDDPRIREINDALFGDHYKFTGSDGNYYVGDTHWHSDYSKWIPADWSEDRKYFRSLKMAFYLDAVTEDTGCLRVIPGSHYLGDTYSDLLHDRLYCNGPDGPSETPVEESFGMHGSEIPSIALESRPGDLVVFNFQTKHAAFGGNHRRRMFTLNFSNETAEESRTSHG